MYFFIWTDVVLHHNPMAIVHNLTGNRMKLYLDRNTYTLVFCERQLWFPQTNVMQYHTHT